MEAKPVDEYDAEELLDAVESLHRTRMEAEARVFRLAVDFANIYNGDTVQATNRPGRQRAVRLGGEGTPKVAEFAPALLGARMQMSPFAAKLLIGDALDCCFRLPRLWQRVCAGQARISLVRHVAQATRHLSPAAARHVDAAVADLVDGRLPRSRFETVVDAKVVEADPATAAARENERQAQSFARASRSSESGMKSFTLRAGTPLVVRFDATVAYLARALEALGDTDPEDLRRVKACLVMANPAHAVQLLAAFAAHRRNHPTDADDQQCPPDDGPPDDGSPDDDPPDHHPAGSEPQPSPLTRPRPFRPERPVPSLSELATVGGWRFRPDRLLPRVTVYVHVSQDTLVRDGGGVARFEGGDPVTDEFIRTHLAPYHRFTVTPVIDLANQAPADAYELSAGHRTAVKLVSPADAFPFATAVDRSVDIDHNEPYDPEGSPGQSRLDNLAPLVRFYHRIKTFGAWTVRQPFPGIWVWRDPLGHYYLVDHTGSRKITPPRAGPGATQPDCSEPHDPDLEVQVWDPRLRPAWECAFEHAS